ncbi:porin [Caballeronia sp. dw_19]|uniref:porin n=1 Tax=Caballeronia sp. dw_19 TaxID=2719791 RepID=UPI001BD31A8B|nr:porin [Caballeronia sp. dw_19]
MKKTMIAWGCCTLALAGIALPAHAQSSVTLYGVISVGLVYTNNTAGSRDYALVSGVQQTPHWGLKGVEDLGGGYKTFFTLENGFSITSGALSNGGKLFGRKAFVGISTPDFGSITVGRQVDAMSDALFFYEAAAQFAAFGVPIGDNDNVFETTRVSNAVRYSSHLYSGFQFVGQYGFSNDAGEFNNNSSKSASLTYTNGPFSAAIAYSEFLLPNSASNSNGAITDTYGVPVITTFASNVNRQQMFGLSGDYKLGAAQFTMMVTRSMFSYLQGAPGLSLTNYEPTFTYYVTPEALVGIGYIFTDGHTNNESPKWHQIDTGIDYFLSKRTDVFLVAVYQKAAGDAKFAQIYGNAPSTSRLQFSATVGIRHTF